LERVHPVGQREKSPNKKAPKKAATKAPYNPILREIRGFTYTKIKNPFFSVIENPFFFGYFCPLGGFSCCARSR
jgi:hypothetical protein